MASDALALQIEPHIVAVADGPPRRRPEVNLAPAGSKEKWAQPFEIPIANAGAGLAIIEQATIQREAAGFADVEYSSYLRSGEIGTLRALWELPPRGYTARAPAELEPGELLLVRVHYRGVDDRRWEEAFGWMRTGSGWQLRIVDVHHRLD